MATSKKIVDDSNIESVPYGILLGCDGIRSVVRSAFMNNHRDFDFDLKGAFGRGKSLHITRPQHDINEGEFLMLTDPLPSMNVFGLPETGAKLNFAMGHPINRPSPPKLMSDDPAVVSEYFRKNFKLHNSFDADEFGRQWVSVDWAATQCNFYHSSTLSAIIIGELQALRGDGWNGHRQEQAERDHTTCRGFCCCCTCCRVLLQD